MSEADRKSFQNNWIPGLIILAAILLRFIALGSTPLSENEADLALQSLSISNGISDFNVTQPLYVMVTSVLFKFFGANDFTARTFPAFMGLLIVCLPVLFRQELGCRKMILLTFFLAVDPVGIAWSKTADGIIPVICLLGLTAYEYKRKRNIAGNLLLSLAMTGGERFWPAAAALFAAGAIMAGISRKFVSTGNLPFLWLKDVFSKKNICLLIVFWLLFSVGMFGFPSGLNAIGQGFLNGFRTIPGHDFRQAGTFPILLALFFYLGPGIILFILRFIRMIKMGQFPTVLLMSGIILFGILLAGFQQGILLLPWLSIPLYYFAAESLIWLADSIRIEKNLYSALAVAIPLCLFSFLVFRIAELLQMGDPSLPLSFTWNEQLWTIPLTRLQGYLIIFVICILIFGFFIPYLLNYFSPGNIRPGLVSGCLIIILGGILTNSWAAAGFRLPGNDPAARKNDSRHELILGVQVNQTDQPIFDMIHEIGIKQNGFENGADGLILVPEDSMLRWELHNYPNIRFSEVLNLQTEKPSYVITDSDESAVLSKEYAGMPFNWKTRDEWYAYSKTDWLKWIMYRITNDRYSPLTFWQESRWLTDNIQK